MLRLLALAAILPVLTSCEQDSKAKNQLYGEVEADEIDVASRLPGRVREIKVVPGQVVKAGDVLVEFEDDVMSAKRQGATATIAAAQSKRDIAQDAVRPEEKTQLRAAVEAARTQTEFASKTLERTATLLKEGAVAQQAYDEVQYKYQASVEALNAAQARLRMAEAGARPEEKAGAQALLDQAKTLLSEVEAYEKDLSLKAPVAGEVSQILNHEGELVPTGYPVVTLLRAGPAWVTVNVPETRLAELPKGAPVSVIVPGLKDKKTTGKVTYIAALGAFATRTYTQDKGAYDLKTFEVRVTLDESLPELRPGMTAIVSAPSSP